MRTTAASLALLLVITARARAGDVSLELLGTYATGLYDQVAAEIGAHDPASQRLFVTNSATNTIDVLDMQDPRSLSLLFSIPLMAFGDGPSSVAFKNGLGAVAVAADPKTDPGKVVFFTQEGVVLSSVVVGALPDSLTFTPDGKRIVVANEGEPNDEYTVDPEGTISIIDVSKGGAAITQANVRTVTFTGFNGQKAELRRKGIRIYGPKVEEVIGEGGEPETIFTEGGASVAQDIEPEFVAISADSRTAFVTLQENNAFAIVDIHTARVKKIVALGYKLHILPRNGLDASDRDDEIRIKSWPVRGMYLPDAVAAFEVGGRTYLITANEGDTRDWDGFSEEERIGDLTLGGILALIPDLQENENLGRLKVTNSPPDGKGEDEEGEDVYRRLYSFGGRSFSIWDEDGRLVFDSGEQLERITARLLGADFNSDNAEGPTGDGRSDDKGPEPEAVAVGKVGHKLYAFIGLERPGGVVTYDISKPWAPRFVDYINNRDFAVEFNIEDCNACEEDCGDDCVSECEDCKSACKTCEECPEGEDCTEECALCEECTPKYEACPECTPECMAIATCTEECTAECIEENCPMAGVEGRDPLDLGPEGVLFIPAGKGPAGFGSLVVVTNEVSGSTTVYRVKDGDDD
jgi:DNA-binding beta-propeller fold protein YncE